MRRHTYLVKISTPTTISEFSNSKRAKDSYAFLTNANAVSTGPASFSANADNEQPLVETGMFRLQSATSNVLLPYWVNSDNSVVSGQVFAETNDAIIVTG